MGGNDLCTDTVAEMTAVATFRSQFVAAMNALTAGSPDTRVYVASIPNAYQLWQLFRSNWWARTVWSIGGVCQSLLANPTSSQTVDVQRRATVAQRNADYNTQLAQVCALYVQCRFDGNAVFNTAFTASDVSGDYFHPSIAGQAKLAAVSWAAGYWPNGGPPPDAAPSASFTASCTALTCSLDGTASSDDQGIVAYGWSFGDTATGIGETATHTYASDGTYPVTLTVTDSSGQTGVASGSVTVAAAGGGDPTVHLASAIGSAATRKGGWTATITVTARDGDGVAVGGAAVTGTWTGGATGGCTTGSGGSCSFSLNAGRKTASVTWAIGGITAAGYAYDAGANVATQVTVSAP
jgi:PKD repeat protein